MRNPFDPAQALPKSAEFLRDSRHLRGGEGKETGWSAFLKRLKERGLKGVRLITSDACIGLAESAAESCLGGGFVPTTRSSASCARSDGARVWWARSLTFNPRSTSRKATPHRRHGVVDQEISEHRVAEGPADERRHHRLSRAPLTQPKVRKILDTTRRGARMRRGGATLRYVQEARP